MIVEPFSFLCQPFAAAVEHKWNMEGCDWKFQDSLKGYGAILSEDESVITRKEYFRRVLCPHYNPRRYWLMAWNCG